jgi:TPR repeat protein
MIPSWFRLLPRHLACGVALLLAAPAALAQSEAPPEAPAEGASALLADNSASVAVVIGNKDYRQTVPVDFAHNDAAAMRDYLVGTLGFREENVILLQDATLSEMVQVFGSEAQPQAGRLWRAVEPGASNVWVFYSGHGVPDMGSGQPFLLPADGDPNSPASGFPLDTLYRNLALVKERVGEGREVVVMIDACFTGETGRGESLLAVSAPGFVPAAPRSGDGLVKLVATSGAAPANWDEELGLGLFTSRFLMGAGGLADSEGPVEWDALGAYLAESVEAAARRDSGRPQVPEITPAALLLPPGEPVAPVAEAVALGRDEAAWEAARGSRAALERYVAECDGCGHRDEALLLLASGSEDEAREADRAEWERLSALGDHQAYLDGCGAVCAYRDVAQAYLSAGDPSKDPRVARCDALAASMTDLDRPEGVAGVPFDRLDGHAALAACEEAVRAFPDERRLHAQVGRALDRLGRYGEAMEAYQRGADMGSMSALGGIAVLHENGEGVPPSPETAFPLYLEAAEGGNVTAMTNAARMLEYGRGTTQDVAAAIQWYQRAAEAGDTFSMTKLVPYYVEGGPGIEQDPEAGFALFQKAIEGGDPMAMATVAVLIDNGFGEWFPGRDAPGLVLEALSTGEPGLSAVVATTAGPQQLSPGTVRAVQEAVTASGHYDGEIDGAFNPLFIRALDAYARSTSSQIDG